LGGRTVKLDVHLQQCKIERIKGKKTICKQVTKHVTLVNSHGINGELDTQILCDCTNLVVILQYYNS